MEASLAGAPTVQAWVELFERGPLPVAPLPPAEERDPSFLLSGPVRKSLNLAPARHDPRYIIIIAQAHLTRCALCVG